MNTFVVDYEDHPQMIEIHAELKRLSGPVHDVGHAPYTKGVLRAAEGLGSCSLWQRSLDTRVQPGGNVSIACFLNSISP